MEPVVFILERPDGRLKRAVYEAVEQAHQQQIIATLSKRNVGEL